MKSSSQHQPHHHHRAFQKLCSSKNTSVAKIFLLKFWARMCIDCSKLSVEKLASLITEQPVCYDAEAHILIVTKWTVTSYCIWWFEPALWKKCAFRFRFNFVCVYYLCFPRASGIVAGILKWRKISDCNKSKLWTIYRVIMCWWKMFEWVISRHFDKECILDESTKPVWECRHRFPHRHQQKFTTRCHYLHYGQLFGFNCEFLIDFIFYLFKHYDFKILETIANCLLLAKSI